MENVHQTINKHNYCTAGCVRQLITRYIPTASVSYMVMHCRRQPSIGLLYPFDHLNATTAFVKSFGLVKSWRMSRSGLGFWFHMSNLTADANNFSLSRPVGLER
jgi:hypothetical protein